MRIFKYCSKLRRLETHWTWVSLKFLATWFISVYYTHALIVKLNLKLKEKKKETTAI